MKKRIAITIIANQNNIELFQVSNLLYTVQWGTTLMERVDREYAMDTYIGWVAVAMNQETKQ